MSWEDQLRQGTIDGVPFFAHAAPKRGGRRNVVHEFPLRDQPEVQELGKGTQRFVLEAFVLGNDYMAARDALEAVLEKKGKRRLVHPYRGEMDVYVDGDYTAIERTEQGGYCEYQIPFVRASAKTYPTATIDMAGQSKTAATAAIAQARIGFSQKFTIVAAAGFVVDSALARLNEVTATITATANSITTLPDEAAKLVSGISQYSGAVSSLILAPGELAQSIVQMIGQLQMAAANPLAAFDALKLLFGFSPGEPGTATTPSRALEESNRVEIGRLVSRVAVVSAASAAADIDYASYDDALAARDTLMDQFDALVQDTDDSDIVDALIDAQSAMNQDLTTRGLQLPRLRHITLLESTPATVLAWRLYGDPTQASTIADRNKVSDPFFLPGGVPIEVIV
jgi:prophage DNA circulation protein